VAKESREPTDIDRRDALQHQIAVFLTFPSEDALVLKRRYRYTTAVSRDSEAGTDWQVAMMLAHAARRPHARGGEGRGTVTLEDASAETSGKRKKRKDVEVSRGRFAYLACAYGVAAIRGMRRRGA